MNMNFENFRLKLSKISDTVTERSYYPLICEFIQNFRIGTTATPEESLAGENKNVGFPDITVRRQNGDQIGWWEMKLPNDSLGKDSFQIQFSKYKEALENVLFTNLREWQLWQWDQEGKSQKVGEIIFDFQNYSIGEEEKLDNLLQKFFEYSPYLARTPKQLALALAKKARFLSKQVEEAIDENDKDSDLTKLKQTFESTLIQDIGVHQFSNMIAETLAYSLFLAFLEHIHRGKSSEITLTSAIDYLPKNIPILFDLYSLVTKVSASIPTIFQATQMLLDQLKFSDMEKIYYKLVEHKPGEDPVIQFYEPFLKEYDPKEREARGVYYTPKPVVDFIIRSVDHILREKFGKEKGLADQSVHLLDPATGTGTFLMSAIQQIHENVKKENINQGEEMVQKEFNKIVMEHILKHFYGFELMVAPYAIAHLKLTMLLETLGFNFEMTKDDNDSDNDRLKVYLANTLDDPEKPPQDFFGFNSIPEESEKAREVKKNVPILVITGNPPYSNFGRMNRGDWILGLLKDYKKDLNETKINLDDDFIKFIRFAQWKLEQTGQGVFAMITSNTFIDGITHRQMRRSIMDTFDEIYIYDLHGNLRKGEKCPDGSKDENVFDIQTGVSINFFIKHKEKQPETNIYSCDLWGLREEKFAKLLSGNFDKTGWHQLSPKSPNWFFVEKNSAVDEEYFLYLKITEVFPHNNSGIQTKRDSLTIQFDTTNLEKIKTDFATLTPEELRSNYGLPEDGRDWTILSAKEDLQKNGPKIINITYRPFDIRKTFFTGKSKGFIAYPRFETTKQMFFPNIGLVNRRTAENSEDWQQIFVSKDSIDINYLSAQTYMCPLYLYEQGQQILLIEDRLKKPNISADFLKMFSKKLGLEFIESGNRDSEITFGPEDVFYYAYAIFHSPTYRTRYAEQLKIDFPRLPLTSSKELFRNLVVKGNELVNLHLLGENPFDKSKTIFDEPEKWNVKIEGTKPENLEDWKVAEVRYEEKDKRVYVNPGQYFEGVEKEVWEFMIGGYQVCEKWLKDRKKADRKLGTDDLRHYMKIIVSLRETVRIMKEIDDVIPGWPMK